MQIRRPDNAPKHEDEAKVSAEHLNENTSGGIGYNEVRVVTLEEEIVHTVMRVDDNIIGLITRVEVIVITVGPDDKHACWLYKNQTRCDHQQIARSELVPMAFHTTLRFTLPPCKL